LIHIRVGILERGLIQSSIQWVPWGGKAAGT